MLRHLLQRSSIRQSTLTNSDIYGQLTWNINSNNINTTVSIEILLKMYTSVLQSTETFSAANFTEHNLNRYFELFNIIANIIPNINSC